MKINLIAVGTKMPAWVQEGFNEYIKRLPAEFHFNLMEIPAIKRTKNTNPAKIMQQEGQLILSAIPKNQHIIALDKGGKNWTTEQLAQQLKSWQTEGRDISLLIGGPEGLSKDCLAQTETRWSLSNLTFPHPLVRIIFAEQLYRAWTILSNHPYHR